MSTSSSVFTCMIFLYIAIALLILAGTCIDYKGFHADYLSKEKTNSIKGVFLLLIIVSHAIPYISRCGYDFSGIGDNYLLLIRNRMGQLVVVMFLFYSGYGIGESFKKKGELYVNHMPTHRILTTLLNFDVAVLFLAIVSLLLSIPFTGKQFLLSFIAWDSLGNSNWYIFCILICYIISFVTLKFTKTNRESVIITLILVIVMTLLLSFFKQPYWYNTMWSYGAGYAFSIYRTKIGSTIQSNYLLSLLFSIILFVVLFNLNIEYRGIKYNFLSISFAIMIVIATMKVSLSNKVLIWIGINLFPMYIFQRIPMIILQNQYESFTGNHPVLFVAISLIVTIGFTYLYRYWRISLR